jgi:hypothetical protein
LIFFQVTDGILECRPSAFKGQFNWGSSELKEATIVDKATNTTPNIIEASCILSHVDLLIDTYYRSGNWLLNNINMGGY